MARLIDADKLPTKVVSVSNSIGQVTWSAVSAIDILTEPTVDTVSVVNRPFAARTSIRLWR